METGPDNRETLAFRVTKDLKNNISKSSACRLHAHTTILDIQTCEMKCGITFEPGASGLPYYCTPPVCLPGVIGALAVWR